MRSVRLTVSALAVLVIAGVSTGCAGNSGPTSAENSPPATSSPPAPFAWPTGTPVAAAPVDVLVGDVMRLVDGRRLSLAWAGPYPRATRIPAGWLVVGGADMPRTWLLRDDGTRLELPGVAFPALSSDGRRLAYRAGDTIVLAEINPAGLHTVASTSGTGKFGPAMIVGDALVLSYTETGGGPDGYDTWYPSRGAYRPSPRSGILVAAALPDTTLLGFDGARCLALIDRRTMAPARRACGLNIIPTWDMPVSPDGHWALALTYAADKEHGSEVAMIDLTTVFDAPRLAVRWPVPPNHDIKPDACVWPDAVTALCGSIGALVRLPVTTPSAATLLVLPDVAIEPGTDSAYAVVPVPRRGVSR
ncbi:MAG: hypothetical protein ACM3JP_00775 [Betaproteobacteria bacterium]